MWVRDTLTDGGRCQSREEPSSQRGGDGGKEETGLLLPFQGGYLLFLFLSVFKTMISLSCVGVTLAAARGAPLGCSAQLLTAVASLVAERGPYGLGSVAVVHRLGCSVAGGIFPDQGLNLCLLQWPAGCLPLSHQGSPAIPYLIAMARSSCFK